MENQKKSNNVLLIVLMILVLGLGGFIVYDKVLKDSKTTNNDNNSSSTIEDNNDNKQETNYQYIINVYKDDNNHLCKSQDPICNQIAFHINAESSNAEIIDIDSTSYNLILYKDNGFKIYNIKDDTITKVNLNIDDYNGISIVNKDYISATKNNNLYLINIKTGQEELSIKMSEMAGDYFKVYSYNNKNIFIHFESITETTALREIYDYNKNKIFSHLDNINIYKDNIYIYSDNEIKKYNLEGKLIETKKEDGVIKGIILDSVVYTKNNELLLKNIETNKITKIDDIELKNIFSLSYYGDDYYHFDTFTCYSADSFPNLNKGYLLIVDTSEGSYTYKIVDGNVTKEKINVNKCF